MPLLPELRCIASILHTTELRTPCLQDRYALCETFCIGWNFIAVDELHSAKHVSNDIPLHKLYGFVFMISVLVKRCFQQVLVTDSHDRHYSNVLCIPSAGDR